MLYTLCICVAAHKNCQSQTSVLGPACPMDGLVVDDVHSEIMIHPKFIHSMILYITYQKLKTLKSCHTKSLYITVILLQQNGSLNGEVMNSKIFILLIKKKSVVCFTYR